MKTKIVKISDDREVTVKELSQLDETMVVALGGKHLDNSGFAGEKSDPKRISEMMLYRNYQVAFSIVALGSEKLPLIGSEAEMFGLMRQFSRRDWAKIADAFAELNEDEDTKENFAEST